MRAGFIGPKPAASKQLKIDYRVFRFIVLLAMQAVGYCCGAQQQLVGHWRFEQVVQLNGNLLPAIAGQPLTADDRKPIDPQPYAFDESGKGNFLEVRGQRASGLRFSEDVPRPVVNGFLNNRSLSLKKGAYILNFDRPLAYCDMQQGWTIEASLKVNLTGTEQVFLCKEGSRGEMIADVSLGFDNMQQKFFIEVADERGEAQRLAVGQVVLPGQWYDVKATTAYNSSEGKTTMRFEVKPSHDNSFTQAESSSFKGSALRRRAGMWVIGRGFPSGFPNSLAVLDGTIDEVVIKAEGMQRRPGQNPLFTDVFTADPAALVVNDEVFVYAGRDKASPGGWFNMPEWVCYSSRDMKNWKAHGAVLAAKDFVGAYPNSSWAAQVVQKGSKFYFYVTLDGKDGHFIAVAEGDSPLGPFKEVSPGKPLVIDSMTKDSHRPNADIDPTVLTDHNGTTWMAWGNGDCYMAQLDTGMTKLAGPIVKVPYRNYSEGPWLFRRNQLYYNVYAADAPGVQPEQIAYATAPAIEGPWTYRGLLTGPAKHGFTIHPSIIEFKGQWYFFYHDGAYGLHGEPGGDTRRSVCVEYLYFNDDGTIKPITLTTEGISVPANR